MSGVPIRYQACSSLVGGITEAPLLVYLEQELQWGWSWLQ